MDLRIPRPRRREQGTGARDFSPGIHDDRLREFGIQPRTGRKQSKARICTVRPEIGLPGIPPCPDVESTP